METKDLNSIGLAYLQMVEKKNTEAKKNHADALHKNQKALDVHSDEDEDHNDDPTDGDGDIDAADLKKLRADADKDDKKFDKKKKSSKKDGGDDQDKFKAYTGDDKNDQEGTKVSEDKEDKFEPHMMYDPKTGKGYKAEKKEDHLRMKKMGYTHDKPEEIDESTDLQEGAARQAALHKGLMDYCKEIGKDHMDHKDFMDHAKHVKAGNWDEARDHANNMDTEVREKIHTLAIDHLGQGAASELYGGDRKLSKNKGDGKLHASYNESVNVDDVLALIDQGYTLDQAEAMVAEACGGGTSAPVINSSKKTDDKKLLKASRKQPKAGDNDRNMANNQRSIPAKGADTAPVRPGTKQNQRDFDKAARMAKSKDKVSLKPMPAALSKKMKTDEELHGDQHKLDHNKDGKITGPDLENVRKDGAVRKESVMDRVSNMVERIRVDIQEDRDQDQEDRDNRAGPGGKYISYYDSDNAAIKRQLELGRKGKYRNAQKKIDDHESGKKHNPAIASMIKDRNKTNPGTNVVQMKRNNVNASVDESVQEAAKPTAIHHSTPVTAAQANDAEAEGRAGDTVARRGANMTEKEFIDIHKVPETVDPAFDGNVAAKDTAENIKKAPKAMAKTPNTPTSKGDQKIMPDPTPYGGPAVKTESYMDKYAKYIRGEI